MMSKAWRSPAVLFSTFALFSAFACVNVIQLSAQEPAAEMRPRAVIDEPLYDFGSVVQGQKVEHDFVVKNGGSADLLIQRLVPACGCTAANSTSAPLKAGEEAKVHVALDTEGFSGEKLKTIRIYTNDPETPAQLLTLKGIVIPDIIVEPPSVLFDEVIKGSPSAQAEKTVTVKVRPGASSRITGVKNFARYLNIKEVTSTDTQRVLSVSVSPDAPLGELRERVVITVSGGKESSINLPVFGVIKGQLVLRPPQLSFDVIEGTKELERTVRLENLGDKRVQIKEVRSDSQAVTASFNTIEPGKTYQIVVRVDPSKVRRDLRASIQITTDSDEEGNLSLSVYGILPPKV